MCAKDNLIRRKSSLLTSTQTSNYVNTFSLDFAFSFAITISIRLLIARGNVSNANILSLIAFIISYRLFADKLVYALTTVVPIIILVNKTQLSLISGDIAAYTLLARFIPTTKIRNLLLKTLENAAKSRILLACADRRTRQYYLTICAILADYKEQVLLTSIKKNRYCTRYTKHYNFNIYVSLATDTLHLLLKGLVIKMLDFMQDILDDIYPSTVVSPLFILKAPFALHFIRAVYNLVTLAQYKSHNEDTLAYIQGALERINVFKEEFRHALTHIIQDIRMYRALDSICTRANSEAHYITIVKQFYSITNKKEYILQICLHNSQRTALLAANYATILIPGIQPYLTKLPLSKVTANIAISNFTHAAALYLILIIINYTRYDKDRKHIAYIRAFSKVLLFNNNRQINNTTRMLSMPFKFYDLSTIICLVHLIPRDLPNSTTHEYNRLYSLTFNINLLHTLQEYQRKRTQNN
ncbi:hypothetical protein HBI18_216050 [Parastagonospora nodorum]|nr:hypothetical protein HBI18_216050 [Parastagonospora nodorum]